MLILLLLLEEKPGQGKGRRKDHMNQFCWLESSKVLFLQLACMIYSNVMSYFLLSSCNYEDEIEIIFFYENLIRGMSFCWKGSAYLL